MASVICNHSAPYSTPSSTDTLIVSDIHLGLPSSRPNDLLAVLESWKFDRLLILGDTFHDVSFRHLCNDGWRLMRFIRYLATGSVCEVIWINGNHDRELASAVTGLLGIRGRESFDWTSGGRRFCAMHGDCFDEFVHTNRRFANATSALFGWCQRHLSVHGQWLEWLDRWHVNFSGMADKVAERAAEHACRNAYDVVVCGHTHKPSLKRFGSADNSVSYVNPGAWVSRPAGFVTVNQGAVTLNAVP